MSVSYPLSLSRRQLKMHHLWEESCGGIRMGFWGAMPRWRGLKIGLLLFPLIADYRRRATLKVMAWINSKEGDAVTLVSLNPFRCSHGIDLEPWNANIFFLYYFRCLKGLTGGDSKQAYRIMRVMYSMCTRVGVALTSWIQSGMMDVTLFNHLRCCVNDGLRPI